MNTLESLRYFLPETFLICGAFLALAVDLFSRNKKIVAALSLLTLALFFFLAKSHPAPAVGLSLFFGTFMLDPLTQFVRYLVPAVTFITLLASLNYRPLLKLYEGEYYVLFLFMVFGLILMGASSNLLMIFLSVEFVSILSYLMVGLLKKDARSKEAAIKYLLFGSAASAVMLYGISLLFGISGSLDFEAVGQAVSRPEYFSLSTLALIFFLVGLGFKISMAPFHMWAPDVYEAAPTPVTAFLTVAPKAVGMIALIRVLGIALAPLSSQWQHILIVLSILTMTIGNLSAIAQTNIKRLIAYSSIAQAGYILMGLAVFGSVGIQSVLIYLVTYALTNLGVFTAIIIVSNQTGSDEITSYAGLAQRAPGVAASLTLFLISLAGIPPLAGFIGKWFVFSSTIQNGFYVLAIAAALNSTVAAYYYFKIVKAMYLTPAETETPVLAAPSLKIALGMTLLGTIIFGLAPQPLIDWIQHIRL
ncbi:MAG: NADH-quinone oxidoreductase subunit N [Candidatus Omnitrophica bacterium]|nr:NADH-quinone oxidoreductase subunit N [Candidatus Omnitrophota bacterium]